MIRNFTPAEWKEEQYFNLVFDDGRGNGFWFDCDEDGNLSPKSTEAAAENHKWCLENPDKFVRFNKVVVLRNRYKEPAHGVCSCGTEVWLNDSYMGACECPGCGRWYSLSGQELLPPDEWGWDGTPLDEEY